jgi:hypothetical protein
VSLLWLLACRRTLAPLEPVVGPVAPDGDGGAPAAGTPVRDGPWTDGEWSLFIPPGWVGTAGPPPRVLAIEDPRTRYRVELVEGAPDPDWSCWYDGPEPMRGPTAFRVERARSCAVGSRVALEWIGTVDLGVVRVVASFPEGTAFAGEQTVTPIVASLRR